MKHSTRESHKNEFFTINTELKSISFIVLFVSLNWKVMKTILFLVAILPLAVFGNKICLKEETGNVGNVCYLGGDKRTGMDTDFTAWQNIR